MKRLVSLFLCLCLMSTAALALEPVRDDRGFADAELHWSRDYISVCWRLGLMEGVSETQFDTEGNLTVAQCAAVAARLHARLNGLAEPEKSVPWYQGYVDYMTALGCTLPQELNEACTRAQFFAMMDAVVPEAMLNPINEVNVLPDTKDEAILRFYRAGILTGMDEYGTFRGSRSLTRAECAAMVARIADEQLRLSFRPKRSDGSAAMQCLFVPADTAVMTAGGYSIDAGLFTAVLTHALELRSARYQLIDHPDYERYLNSWLGSPYAVDFERYLSENCGVNEYSKVDWNSMEADSGKTLAQAALDEALDWLRQHAALRLLAQKYDLSLTEAEATAIDNALTNAKVEGESRIRYVTAAAEDLCLTEKLCAVHVPSEDEVRTLLAKGDYLCVEFVRFEKYDLKTGRPLTEAELDYVRAGAELFIQELKDRVSHYFLEYQTRKLTCAYTAPRCTLWSQADTPGSLWNMLWSLQPLGVSPVVEDEEGVYVYMVANPMVDDSLMEDLRLNYGEDLALRELETRTAALAVSMGEPVLSLDAAEFAARVISA